jgi:hypothetical protein
MLVEASDSIRLKTPLFYRRLAANVDLLKGEGARNDTDVYNGIDKFPSVEFLINRRSTEFLFSLSRGSLFRKIILLLKNWFDEKRPEEKKLDKNFGSCYYTRIFASHSRDYL